jgi:hypothetical protein
MQGSTTEIFLFLFIFFIRFVVLEIPVFFVFSVAYLFFHFYWDVWTFFWTAFILDVLYSLFIWWNRAV